MLQKFTGAKLVIFLTVFLVFFAGTSVTFADQITMTYIDAGFEERTLTLDCESTAQELALAASLFGEDGVHVVNESTGNCSLAEVASALATAAPLFAASVAKTLSLLSPENTSAIVTAINAIPGVNKVAVLSAVHFGLYANTSGPQPGLPGFNAGSGIEIPGVEPEPSRN